MKVPFFDARMQNALLHTEILGAMARVLESGRFIMGPEVEAFEHELAAALGVRHVVGLSSGTDALLAGLMALEVGPGDEVVTTPFSFFATAGAIARLGARPVFADIERDSFNLDPEAAAAACNDRTRAVIPVHLFGRPAKLPDVHVPILEDAAQAIGAAALGGTASCLSFFPTKNLGGLGDGGALCTNDDTLANKVRLLRTHGGQPKYVHEVIGGNFRLDAMQAAVLRVKLPLLVKWLFERQDNADRYCRLFGALSEDQVRLPQSVYRHTYNQYVIRVPWRDELREYLMAQGVGTEVYYPVPLHLQPCFRDLGYREGQFPNAEAAAREALALPIYPGLTEAQQAYVVEQVAIFSCSRRRPDSSPRPHGTSDPR